ncbi:ferritin-like domain-containing protein [candidate division KSB1 bacterium]|nr:ferritin-like domain-containing protein [candidate division KSB1 bacterium]
MTKEKLIELLNNDLKKEYAAAIQYIQHVAMIKGAAYGSIKKELTIHANEEIQHAMILADQIAYHGGVPTVDVDKIWTHDDTLEMLKQDLAGEEDAVSRYSKRIDQAEELKLLALGQKLREILIMEQEHAMDLQEALGI